MSWVVPIRSTALPAWRRLQTALVDVDAVPCRDRIEWISAEAQDRQYAVAHCSRCPVLHQCGAYAQAAGERSGVWGGADRTPRKGAPPSLPMFDTTTDTDQRSTA